MNPIRRTHQAVSLVLAAFVTLGVLSALNGLAAPDSAAVTQLVCAATASRG